RDITERKQIEEVLAQERNLLRTLIDHLPDYIFTRDRENRYSLVNQAMLEFLGVQSAEEIIGKSDTEMTSLKLADWRTKEDEAIIATGVPVVNREEAAESADGTIEWLLVNKVPLRASQGDVIGLVGIAHDITQRKHIEQVEREQRILLEALLDNSITL